MAGGGGNTAAGAFATFATVAGGVGNTASGDLSTVGGGNTNTASGISATVAGGNSNAASANFATVGGGSGNSAGGAASAVPGGQLNTAQGSFSFAAGRRAKANHQGSFVRGDSTDADVASSGNDQFVIRAAGNVRIVDGAMSLNDSNFFLNADGPEGDAGIFFFDGTGTFAFLDESILWDDSEDRFKISNDLSVQGDVKLGSNAELFCPGGGENLRIIRGTVQPNGAILFGSGFTISRTQPGRYIVSWTTSFAQVPTVIVNKSNSEGDSGGCGTSLGTEAAIDITCNCSAEGCSDAFQFHCHRAKMMQPGTEQALSEAEEAGEAKEARRQGGRGSKQIPRRQGMQGPG